MFINLCNPSIALILLISVFSLVTSGRPILPGAELGLDYSLRIPITLRNVFESWAGLSSSRGEESIHTQLNQDDATIKAVTHSIPSNEANNNFLLFDALTSSNNDLRTEIRKNNEAEGTVAKGKTYTFSSDDNNSSTLTLSCSMSSDGRLASAPPFVVIITSCIAAFVGLLIICLVLYTITILRSRVIMVQNSWKMLSRLERHVKGNHGRGWNLLELNSPEPGLEELPLVSAKNLPVELPDVSMENNFMDNLDLITFMDELIAEETFSGDEELNKFEDAISDPPTPQLKPLPEIKLSAPKNNHPDLPFSLLSTEPGNYPISRSPNRKLLEMREAIASPVARPAWSLRADEDPSLFVPSHFSTFLPPSTAARSSPLPTSDILPITVPVPRQRAYRSSVPEFDLALAMQLRPGLGLGADSAWMVRFLMAMFGWFTVLLTSRREPRQRRLGA